MCPVELKVKGADPYDNPARGVANWYTRFDGLHGPGHVSDFGVFTHDLRRFTG